MAKFILGPLGFPYSIDAGAVPDPSLLAVAGIAVNVTDHILFSKDHQGNMFTIGTSYDAVLAAHFSERDPHNTKLVIIDDGNLSLNGDYIDYSIKRIGIATASIVIEVSKMAQNAIVEIDNVWVTAGLVTVTSDDTETEFVIDHETIDTSATLTGKGQFELIVDVANNKIYLTNLET